MTLKNKRKEQMNILKRELTIKALMRPGTEYGICIDYCSALVDLIEEEEKRYLIIKSIFKGTNDYVHFEYECATKREYKPSQELADDELRQALRIIDPKIYEFIHAEVARDLNVAGAPVQLPMYNEMKECAQSEQLDLN